MRPVPACAIASALAGGVLMACTGAPPSLARLRATLDAGQTRRLEAIAAERRRIALLGLVLGAAVALVLTSRGASWCWSVAALLLAQRAFYAVAPKSDWLVLHLDRVEQRRAWLEVYADMRARAHAGAAAAALVYVLARVALARPR